MITRATHIHVEVATTFTTTSSPQPPPAHHRPKGTSRACARAHTTILLRGYLYAQHSLVGGIYTESAILHVYT